MGMGLADLMTSDLVAAVLRVDIHPMEASAMGTWKRCVFRRVLRERYWRVGNLKPDCYYLNADMLLFKDQMTIMVESSRTFLFTEYARKGCGVLSEIGTDPKVWDRLPVSKAFPQPMLFC